MNKSKVPAALLLASFLAFPALSSSSWLPSEGPVLLQCPPGADFVGWRLELARAGILLRHAFPPAGGLWFPEQAPDLDSLDLRLPPGTRFAVGNPEAGLRSSLEGSFEGAILLNAHLVLSGLKEASLPPGPVPDRPLLDDAFLPDGPPPPLRTCSSGDLYLSNSEYMLGGRLGLRDPAGERRKHGPQHGGLDLQP